jgi:hypothetical protein
MQPVFNAFINVLTEQPNGLSSSLAPVGDVSRVGEVLYAGSMGPLGESTASPGFSAPTRSRRARAPGCRDRGHQCREPSKHKNIRPSRNAWRPKWVAVRYSLFFFFKT